MTTNDQIKNEKIQYDIREAAQIIALSSRKSKFNKFEYLTGEEILPFDNNNKKNNRTS